MARAGGWERAARPGRKQRTGIVSGMRMILASSKLGFGEENRRGGHRFPLGVWVAAHSRDSRVRAAAMRSGRATRSLLRGGAEDPHPLVRCAAVGNPHAPEAVVRAGARDATDWLRCAAVKNPRAPEDVVRAGFDDPSAHVRESAVLRRDAPTDLVGKACFDQARAVALAAASSPRLPEDVAEQLSEATEVVAIQRALAANPVVPERIRVVARMRAEALRTAT